MTGVLDLATSEAGTVVFELDRFEPTADGRIEIDGWWSGVRGRRFVRPTLTLRADGKRCRLLADLEDKPWAANDDEPWHAAFAWDLDGEAITDVELSVAPDIAVALPPPGAEPKSARRSASGRVARRARSDTASLHRELQQLRQQLGQQRAEAERQLAEERRSAAALLGEERRTAAVRLDEERRAAALRLEEERRAAALRLDEERETAAHQLEELRRSAKQRLGQYRREIERLRLDATALGDQLQAARAEAASTEARHHAMQTELQRARETVAGLEAARAVPGPAPWPSEEPYSKALERHSPPRSASHARPQWAQRLLALTLLVAVLLSLAVMTHVL
jgi:hypothetical protein